MSDFIPNRGAVARPLLLEVARDLTPADIARVGDAPKVSVPTVQKLRAVHHRQAQLLAQGRTLSEVAAIVGCTTQRLVQLQVDPSFAELVVYYQDMIMTQALEDGARLRDKIVDVGEMAIDEMRERMEDDARRKTMPIGEIRKIAEFAMDRTVAPPKQAQTGQAVPAQVTISFGRTLKEQAEAEDVIDVPSASAVSCGQGSSVRADPSALSRSVRSGEFPDDKPVE